MRDYTQYYQGDPEPPDTAITAPIVPDASDAVEDDVDERETIANDAAEDEEALDDDELWEDAE